MSLSSRSYTKESRSSAHYSRSSSYHSGANHSSIRHRTAADERPLSTRLIERDISCPSLAWNWDWNDPFFFDRFRWRIDPDIFQWNFRLGRSIPIYHRSWNNSTSSRVIPIRYSPSSSSSSINHRRQLSKDENFSSSFLQHPNESSMMRENRLASDDWPPIQGPLTRKRTSMTILLRRPYIDQCEVPYYHQTPSTPTYPQSVRMDYY